MQAVFIRHKLDSTPKILEDLWHKRLIAVHYANIRSTDPKDYDEAGKDTLTRLWEYCESGSIVGATFRTIRPVEMIVGEIEKGSKIEATEYDNRIYKTVQLKNVQEVSYRDYPLLAAIQPPHCTVNGWPSAQKYLEAILGKTKIPWDVSSLHPSQLEVICYEYLRMRGILSGLLLPIGRSSFDIDIYGFDGSGENVFAQVTHSPKRVEVKEKLNRLKEYQSPGTKLIFFGCEDCRVDDRNVQYIDIETVFATFSSAEENSVHHKLISKMLKWEKAA